MRDHNSFSALTKIKLLDRYKFLYTWDGRAIDFAFLYSLTAKSYSPLLMLPRIVLGKLNNVRNLCSIPWTDLIFSAWSYSRAIQNRERQREKCNKCDQCCIRCYISNPIKIWILQTCLSNRGWKARLACKLTPRMQLNKWEVPEPSGSSSIRFNFDSISGTRIRIPQIKIKN